MRPDSFAYADARGDVEDSAMKPAPEIASDILDAARKAQGATNAATNDKSEIAKAQGRFSRSPVASR